MTAVHIFVGALFQATVPVCSINSKVPFSFEHIIITLIPPHASALSFSYLLRDGVAGRRDMGRADEV